MYPKSEENIKSISVKFSKYDKKFQKSLDIEEMVDDMRGFFSPAMVATLQKSRQLAEQKVRYT